MTRFLHPQEPRHKLKSSKLNVRCLLISVVSVASTAFQLVYVARMFQSFYAIISIFRDPSLTSSGDPKLLAGAISQALMLWILGAIVGLIGVALAWYVLQDKKSRPAWFVSASRSFAFAWMVFVPIGTIIGFLMLRWRKPAGDAQEAT